jgi:hypothetical protein
MESRTDFRHLDVTNIWAGRGDDNTPEYTCLSITVSAGRMFFVEPTTPIQAVEDQRPAELVVRILPPSVRPAASSHAAVTFYDGADLRGEPGVVVPRPQLVDGRVTVQRHFGNQLWNSARSSLADRRRDPAAYALTATLEEYLVRDQLVSGESVFYSSPAFGLPLTIVYLLPSGAEVPFPQVRSASTPAADDNAGPAMDVDADDVGNAHAWLLEDADEQEEPDTADGAEDPLVVGGGDRIVADNGSPVASEDAVPVPDPFEVSEEGSPLPEGRGLVLAPGSAVAATPVANQPPVLGGASMLEGIRARMVDRYQEAVQQILGGRPPATADEIVDVLAQAGMLYAVGLSVADLVQ